MWEVWSEWIQGTLDETLVVLSNLPGHSSCWPLVGAQGCECKICQTRLYMYIISIYSESEWQLSDILLLRATDICRLSAAMILTRLDGNILPWEWTLAICDISGSRMLTEISLKFVLVSPTDQTSVLVREWIGAEQVMSQSESLPESIMTWSSDAHMRHQASMS